MMRTLGAWSRSPACPLRRVALSVLLGALAVGFGVALMTPPAT